MNIEHQMDYVISYALRMKYIKNVFPGQEIFTDGTYTFMKGYSNRRGFGIRISGPGIGDQFIPYNPMYFRKDTEFSVNTFMSICDSEQNFPNVFDEYLLYAHFYSIFNIEAMYYINDENIVTVFVVSSYEDNWESLYNNGRRELLYTFLEDFFPHGSIVKENCAEIHISKKDDMISTKFIFHTPLR